VINVPNNEEDSVNSNTVITVQNTGILHINIVFWERAPHFYTYALLCAIQIMCIHRMVMSSSVPTDSGYLGGRTSANFSDVNISFPQRKKSVNNRLSEGPLSPTLRSPPFADQHHSIVLCRPHQHGVDNEIANSFNNVALSNSHIHSSVHNYEPVPPPKPPRRSSRTGEFSFDAVNGSRSNTTSPELASVEEPPPIPIKKRNKKPFRYVACVFVVYNLMNVALLSHSECRLSSLTEIGETVRTQFSYVQFLLTVLLQPAEEPPPIPVKQRRSMSMNASSSLDRNVRAPNWDLSPEPRSPLPEDVSVSIILYCYRT